MSSYCLSLADRQKVECRRAVEHSLEQYASPPHLLHGLTKIPNVRPQIQQAPLCFGPVELGGCNHTGRFSILADFLEP